MSLRARNCVLAKTTDKPLGKDQCLLLKKELQADWVYDEDNNVLSKVFTFKNFREPFNLLVKISKMAEEQNHHPVLKLAYGMLEVTIWTHKVNGLMESDFIFAAKVDHLCGL